MTYRVFVERVNYAGCITTVSLYYVCSISRLLWWSGRGSWL